MRVQNVGSGPDFAALTQYDRDRAMKDSVYFENMLGRNEKLTLIFDLLKEQKQELKVLKNDVYQHSMNITENQNNLQKFMLHCFRTGAPQTTFTDESMVKSFTENRVSTFR